MILTFDLGTTVTKAVLWDEGGHVSSGRSVLRTDYGSGGRAEQDPGAWWPSLVAACRACLAGAGHGLHVDAIGFAAARQTFVPVAPDGTTLGRALLWSDRRAAAEAELLARAHGAGGAWRARERTGIALDAGSVPAKLVWLARHEPERLLGARWILSPRDLMVRHLTGTVHTDRTLASATGLYEVGDDGHHGMRLALEALGEAVGRVGGHSGAGGLDRVAAERLAPVVPSSTVVGVLRSVPADELGVPAGTPVVVGAGDRACEVLGSGASPARPMVSWGTTANVSVPVATLEHARPPALLTTRGALGGWLMEGGLSGAGSVLEWLARLTGRDVETLVGLAAASPPGAHGVIALPWLGGARAPWWRDDVHGAFLGLALNHGPGDLARAVMEAVAWDVLRCLEAVGGRAPAGLTLAGAGATRGPWTEILTSVTGLPAHGRASGEAASTGALLVAAHAVGVDVDLDGVDPPGDEITPDPVAVGAYRALRRAAEAAATSAMEEKAEHAGDPA
ncbi:MAG TPA: FGGY family carbohydrate kinase [Acidimicrobiales bacterium]|nr:FGGY family carbohydrate kinase [Acidimicrobiales bacterium]